MASKLFGQDQQTYAHGAFEDESSTTWDIMYAVAEKYYRSTGSLEPSPKLVTEDGYALGAWLQYLRTQYKKNRKFLTDEQYRLLNAIGMRWGNKYDLQWDEAYSELCEYYRLHKTICVPAAYRTSNGTLLGKWIRRQIEAYTKGQLRPDRIERLEKLGIVWDAYTERWQQMYQSALLFYRQSGNLRVPPKYKTETGKDLHEWLLRQRKQYKNGKLNEDKISLLRQIGFNFESETAAEIHHKGAQTAANDQRRV